MKKITINTTALLVLLLSVFSFPNQVNGAEQQASELDFENFELADSLTENEQELLKNETQKLNENPNSFQTQADKSEIDFSNPSFTKLVHKDNQETFYTVSFDLVGGDHELSSIDIIYDKSLNVEYQKEIHIKDYNGTDVS